MLSRIHLPRNTGDVRTGCDVIVRMLPCPSRPRAVLVGERDAAEVAALDARDAVVPRQPIVEERVVRVEQARPALRSSRMMLSKNSSVSRRKPCRSVSSKSGKSTSDGVMAARLRSCSHWPAKFAVSASDRGSASIRRTCCVEHARLTQPAARREIEQLVVRDAAPQEERQPRRELEIADAIGRCRAWRMPARLRRGTGTRG